MTPIRMRLRELREEAGLSQEALANSTGARQATISNLERGNTTRIEFELLDRLAGVLSRELGRDIDAADLLPRDTAARKRGRDR